MTGELEHAAREARAGHGTAEPDIGQQAERDAAALQVFSARAAQLAGQLLALANQPGATVTPAARSSLADAADLLSAIADPATLTAALLGALPQRPDPLQ